MTQPEFMFKNHLISLKDADMELLEQALADKEADEAQRSLHDALCVLSQTVASDKSTVLGAGCSEMIMAKV